MAYKIVTSTCNRVVGCSNQPARKCIAQLVEHLLTFLDCSSVLICLWRRIELLRVGSKDQLPPIYGEVSNFTLFDFPKLFVCRDVYNGYFCYTPERALVSSNLT
jgi:hypothetical protein